MVKQNCWGIFAKISRCVLRHSSTRTLNGFNFTISAKSVSQINEVCSSVRLYGRHHLSVLHLSEPRKRAKSHLERRVGGACWSVSRQVDGGDVAERQIHGGRRLARQQRTRRPINSERGRIITSTPVRGVTFPLMHWSGTSSHVKR